MEMDTWDMDMHRQSVPRLEAMSLLFSGQQPFLVARKCTITDQEGLNDTVSN